MTDEPADDRTEFTDALVGQVVGGRYVVEALIGSGGMGVVARGRYPELDQEVAIKFMWPHLARNSTLSARFMREARVAAQVHSPHLVRVFDVGKLPSGVPYLAMELLAGRDLGDELRERGPMPVAEAIDYVLQAACGLAEIHARGVVHRDLKPSNLFLAEGAGSRTLKVLDFGVSKESARTGDTPLTASQHVIGTPHYMSPEQIKSPNTVDSRTDVWALGVVLYELLTGKLPFVQEGDGVGELFGLILFTAPRAPRALRPDLPSALEAVVMRCLARLPEQRMNDVAELAAALAPFVGPEAAHRVELARRTLASTTKPVGSSAPRLPVPDAPQPAKATVLEGRARDGASGDAAAVASPVAPARSAPASVAGAEWSRDATRRPAGRRGLVAAVVGAVALTGALGALVVTSRGRTEGEANAEPRAPSIPPPAPGASAGLHAGAGATEAQAGAEANAGAHAEANGGRDASAAPPVTGGASPARAPRPTPRARPRPTAPAPPSDALILDRK